MKEKLLGLRVSCFIKRGGPIYLLSGPLFYFQIRNDRHDIAWRRERLRSSIRRQQWVIRSSELDLTDVQRPL